MNTKTRLQERGTCAYCKKQHAVKDGVMVSHGYTVEFGFQSGNCNGVGRVHYGHQDAPEQLRQSIKTLRGTLEILKKESEELHNAPGANPHAFRAGRAIREKDAEVYATENYIKFLVKNMEEWKPRDTVFVDVMVEEAEQRAAAKAATEAKRTEREQKAAEKKARAEERERKAAEKNAKIIAENLHQCTRNGVVFLEWVASYESRTQMENDYIDRVVQENKENANLDCIHAVWDGVSCIVRENTGRNKQILKF